MLEVVRKIVNSFLPSNILVLWLGFLPFIMWGGFYEGPKVLYFLIGSFFVCTSLIVNTYKKPLKIGKVDLFFLLWLILLSVSSFLGVHPQESFTGGSYRHQGVIFFLALWVTGKRTSILSTNSKRLLIKAVAFGVVAEAVIAAMQFISGSLYFGRPLGTIGETNAVAGYLAMGTYFVYKTLPLKYLVLPVLSIFLSASRAGGLAVATFLAAINRKFFIPILVAALMFVGIVSTSQMTSLFEDRLLFWKMGMTAVAEKPITGYGAESGESIYNTLFARERINLELLMVDRSHNLFLDIAMWSGIPGLFVFALWLYHVFALSDWHKRFALLSFLIYSFFQPLSVVHWILLIITINI